MKVEKLLKPEAKQGKQIARKRERVAAYCRVSTDKEDQKSSFEIQVNAYTKKINANPNWILAGIYTDEGITGTTAKNRTGFRRMIIDCEAGKIDYIITKSISRFARNTLECLACIRHLQSLGVQFLFEKENIDTSTAFSEMLLTVLAAFAQEESRSISENVKWGIRKRYQEGIDRWAAIYGYAQTELGNYQVVPKEAEVVRRIFQAYEHGRSIAEIADALTQEQVESPGGQTQWGTSTIHAILCNEKYVGDIMLQKRYTVDHISHREIKNDCTTIPAYYIQEHHTPLVSRKTYERVQKIREMNCQGGKSEQWNNRNIQYPFAELLRCPFCGKSLHQRHMPVQRNAGCGWLCEGEGACRQFFIRSAILEHAVLRAYAGLTTEEIETFACGKAFAVLQNAWTLIDMKQSHPTFDRVDYYWLDEVVSYISFGKHCKKRAGKNAEWPDDRTVTVHWKCGLQTTVFSGVEKEKDMPYRVLKLYGDYLERKIKEKENDHGDYLHSG